MLNLSYACSGDFFFLLDFFKSNFVAVGVAVKIKAILMCLHQFNPCED